MEHSLGRRVLVAVALLVMGLLVAMVSMGYELSQPEPPSDPLMVAWLTAGIGGAMVVVPLLLRFLRLRDLASGLVLVALSPLGTALPAGFLAVVLLFSLGRWRTCVATAACFVASNLAVVLVTDRASWPALLVAIVAGTVVLGLVGVLVGNRRALTRSLRQEAAAARRERSLVVERARAEERARIAGEMHDSLAHHLGLISLHAGALGRRDDLQPETVRRTGQVVAELSRAASADLRMTLGALQVGPRSTTPPPGADAVPALIDQHRAAGTDLRATLDPVVVGPSADRRLSHTTSRLVHRVLRECLTNASRHAPGAPVTVTLDGDDDGVRLTCRNPLRPGPGSGVGSELGLEGIAERVRVVGGQHRAGREHGHFVVEVAVPW